MLEELACGDGAGVSEASGLEGRNLCGNLRFCAIIVDAVDDDALWIEFGVVGVNEREA